jgi:hypothetical protein
MRVFTMALFCAAFSASTFAHAATVAYPGNGPYTFTGSVTSATGPCPYAAKAKLAGYTLLSKVYVYTGPNAPVFVSLGSLKLVLSPGGTAPKTGLGLNNVDMPNGGTRAAGTGSLIYVPSTDSAPLTYVFKATYATAKSFSAVATLAITTPTGVCKTVYDLTFTKGLPANLSNLL